jgi:DNA polymerase-3 subunit alpha
MFGLPKEEIDKLSKISKQQKTFLNSAETPQNSALQQESNSFATKNKKGSNKKATRKQQKSNSKK